MSKKAFVSEHKDLLQVLKGISKGKTNGGVKKEIKEQSGELKKVLRKK